MSGVGGRNRRSAPLSAGAVLGSVDPLDVHLYPRSLEKHPARGLRFQGDALGGPPRQRLRRVGTHGARWENQLPLFIFGSPRIRRVRAVCGLRPPVRPALVWLFDLVQILFFGEILTSSSVAGRASVFAEPRNAPITKSVLSSFPEMVRGTMAHLQPMC